MANEKNIEGKYPAELLINMFRIAASARNQMVNTGFTDNGGAIHSAERIINILGQRINYPELRHINNLRNYQYKVFSRAALAAYKKGEKVYIEHVSPLRNLTVNAIEFIDKQKTNKQFINFVKQYYQLALLTKEETTRLNKQNRTKIDRNRLKKIGITKLYSNNS